MYFVCNRARTQAALESHCVLILKWKFLSSTSRIFFRWAVLFKLLMQHCCNNILEKYSARGVAGSTSIPNRVQKSEIVQKVEIVQGDMGAAEIG